MRIKLQDLQEVVKQTTTDTKLTETFRNEVNRVFSYSIVTDVPVEQLAKAVNEQLDILEYTNKKLRTPFKPSVLCKFTNHVNENVRLVAARELPERFAINMLNDKSELVQYALAKRLPIKVVKEMVKRYPDDDSLSCIYESRLLEAGVPEPKEPKEPFDGKGERLGDVIKTPLAVDLSDQWYDTQALKFLHDYGKDIEFNWEESVVKNFCNSTKATSGVEIDAKKLQNAIMKRVEDTEDEVLDRLKLKESIKITISELKSLIRETINKVNSSGRSPIK